jgi:methionyl-tRNA formyltransferase
MKQMSETIVFFGSGPVAAASLELLAQDFVIEVVVTKPQPAHHRQPFPVLVVAENLGLKILTAVDQQELSELFAARPKPVTSRLGVVIDHGILISQDVIDYFPLGIINSHFSLLPRWRGADPISFAILHGDQETGVSLMRIVKKLDEGPLIAQQALPIAATATTPSLTDELILLSHQLLVKKLPSYVAGQLQPYTQSAIEPTYSRKLTKADSQLDWTKPAATLEREIRAFTGWPRSRTAINTTPVIITKTHIVAGSGSPGSLWLGENKQLGVYCAEDILIIDSLIPAGKKEMPTAAFLAGYLIAGMDRGEVVA